MRIDYSLIGSITSSLQLLVILSEEPIYGDLIETLLLKPIGYTKGIESFSSDIIVELQDAYLSKSPSYTNKDDPFELQVDSISMCASEWFRHLNLSSFNKNKYYKSRYHYGRVKNNTYINDNPNMNYEYYLINPTTYIEFNGHVNFNILLATPHICESHR